MWKKGKRNGIIHDVVNCVYEYFNIVSCSLVILCNLKNVRLYIFILNTFHYFYLEIGRLTSNVDSTTRFIINLT